MGLLTRWKREGDAFLVEVANGVGEVCLWTGIARDTAACRGLVCVLSLAYERASEQRGYNGSLRSARAYCFQGMSCSITASFHLHIRQ